ncbi:MAG: hypothetical protein KGH60_02480 [Candidatus Micrarchaeota archaeon]|nr:hypothetical protein [Candidatus Micrarchaeota archaeon]
MATRIKDKLQPILALDYRSIANVIHSEADELAKAKGVAQQEHLRDATYAVAEKISSEMNDYLLHGVFYGSHWKGISLEQIKLELAHTRDGPPANYMLDGKVFIDHQYFYNGIIIGANSKDAALEAMITMAGVYIHEYVHAVTHNYAAHTKTEEYIKNANMLREGIARFIEVAFLNSLESLIRGDGKPKEGYVSALVERFTNYERDYLGRELSDLNSSIEWLIERERMSRTGKRNYTSRLSLADYSVEMNTEGSGLWQATINDYSLGAEICFILYLAHGRNLTPTLERLFGLKDDEEFLSELYQARNDLCGRR